MTENLRKKPARSVPDWRITMPLMAWLQAVPDSYRARVLFREVARDTAEKEAEPLP